MPASKKEREGKKGRSKSLSVQQLKELIQLWPTHSIEELASIFGVSKPTIDKVARMVRKANPNFCPKRANDLVNKVATAVRELLADNMIVPGSETEKDTEDR